MIHPGEMGAAVGAGLVRRGHRVCWASEGRSADTSERARQAGLEDVGSLAALVAASDVIVSVCPPAAALDVAASVAEAATGRPGGAPWHFLDANAVAPETTRRVANLVAPVGARFVDGGIVGPPPRRPGTSRLFLSGPDALDLSETLATPELEIHVLSDRVGAASALKLAYAAWTKGSAALLLAVRAAAGAEGVEAALVQEWRTSQPGLTDRLVDAARAAAEKGWRWNGEMDEIAAMFGAAGLPQGFHEAASQLYTRVPRSRPADGERALAAVLDALVPTPH